MEVNPNSSLYDFADDNAAFLNSPVLVSELINIRDNYENMDLGALKEAYSRLTTDLASLSGAGELEKEVRAQISLQQGTLFDANNTGAVTNDTSYDNTQESIKETRAFYGSHDNFQPTGQRRNLSGLPGVMEDEDLKEWWDRCREIINWDYESLKNNQQKF